MSEFTWYSRLLVWAGAVIVLVESVTGRTLGLVTVIGVIALAAGLILFVAGLGLDSRPIRLPIVEDDDFPDTVISPPVDEAPPAAWVPPKPVEADVHTAEEELPAPPAATTRAENRRGAIGIDVTAETGVAGTVCPACHEPLRAGEVAAECRECHTIQHAACWVGNRFHCARDGCGGQGPLEAPVSLEESTGPSTA